MTKTKLIIEWFDGRYSLGWRGWLAKKILDPIINEIVANHCTKTDKQDTHD